MTKYIIIFSLILASLGCGCNYQPTSQFHKGEMVTVRMTNAKVMVIDPIFIILFEGTFVKCRGKDMNIYYFYEYELELLSEKTLDKSEK